MKAVIYIRMAIADPENRKLIRCQEWATANSYTIIGEYNEVANGFSGELPVLSQALRDALTQQAAFICFDDSTLGRDALLNSQRAQTIRSLGISLIFVE